jgi:hypothetical protein
MGKLPDHRVYYDWRDPLAINDWMEDYEVLDNAYDTKRDGIGYMDLRKRQNKSWAMELVRDGVKMAHKSEYVDAIKKYNAALEIDYECVDAFVCRGTAYGFSSNKVWLI